MQVVPLQSVGLNERKSGCCSKPLFIVIYVVDAWADAKRLTRMVAGAVYILPLY
jgi:hypothetical protein